MSGRVFAKGNKVTDGTCSGVITRVYTSFDYSGKPTLCLDVRVYENGKRKETIHCTRANWWEKIE